MHDPMVLLWSVSGLPITPRSFRAWRRYGRFPTWLDIWHIEPNGTGRGARTGSGDDGTSTTGRSGSSRGATSATGSCAAPGAAGG